MPAANPALSPLPYHRALVDYLKREERALWDWFASAQARADYTESLRLALLKATYRLDAAAHPDLYQGAEAAKTALGLDVPLTIYQAQHTNESNAALYFIPGEAHLVLTGPLLTLLTPEEMTGVLGHELAHHVLWRDADGEFLVADHVLQAIAGDPRAQPSHAQSARWYRLYTEVFADRGALQVTGALAPVVAGLVKLQTGLAQVSAASYLAQAEDIFALGAAVRSEELSHPEAFIRARALKLWAERGVAAEADIAAMIEGKAALDDLDLIGQARLTALTRRLIAQVLRPRWFRTDAVLGHARLFFDVGGPEMAPHSPPTLGSAPGDPGRSSFQPATADDPGLVDELTFADGKLRDYLCYVLLDFAAVDAELEELPLAATWDWSRRLGLEPAFEKLLVKELGVKPRTVKKLTQQATALLQQAET